MKLLLYLSLLLCIPLSFAYAQDSTSVQKKEIKSNKFIHIDQIGIGFGLNGINLDLTYKLNSKSLINLHSSYLFYQKKFDQDWGNFNVSSKPNISSFIIGLSYDWFPFTQKSNILKYAKLKTGLQYSFNPNYKFESNLTDQVTWGETIFTTEQVGFVHTTISGHEIQPFLSAGFDQFFKNKKFSLSTDLGILYQGEPIVNMTATNMLEPTVTQAKIIQNNIDNYRFIPYFAFKVGYNFSYLKPKKSVQSKKNIKNSSSHEDL